MCVWGSTSQQTSLTHSSAYQSVPMARQRQLASSGPFILSIYGSDQIRSTTKQKKKQKKENKSSGDPGYPSPPRAPCQTQHMAKPILAPTGITLMTGTQHQLPRLHIRSSETCCHSNEGSNLKTAAKGSTRFLTNKDALERCMQEVSALTT